MKKLFYFINAKLLFMLMLITVLLAACSEQDSKSNGDNGLNVSSYYPLDISPTALHERITVQFNRVSGIGAEDTDACLPYYDIKIGTDDNINNALHYGKTNIVINTCKPMKNWRQTIRKAAVRNNKYCITDESIYIDELKLNSFADAIFQKLPKLDLNKVNKETQELGKEILKLNPNVNYLSFDVIDLWDANCLAKSLLTNIGSLTFDPVTYNVIQDR